MALFLKETAIPVWGVAVFLGEAFCGSVPQDMPLFCI